MIASVPHTGHWSILDDLLRGRFDYVPYSLLSGTHVRLFTRRTLTDLFEAPGYRIRELTTTILPASPAGRARLERLLSLPGASSDLEVAEFLPSPAQRASRSFGIGGSRTRTRRAARRERLSSPG